MTAIQPARPPFREAEAALEENSPAARRPAVKHADSGPAQRQGVAQRIVEQHADFEVEGVEHLVDTFRPAAVDFIEGNDVGYRGQQPVEIGHAAGCNHRQRRIVRQQSFQRLKRGQGHHRVAEPVRRTHHQPAGQELRSRSPDRKLPGGSQIGNFLIDDFHDIAVTSPGRRGGQYCWRIRWVLILGSSR
ncbi:hypothetical protein SDC9_191186 [bioreactor metagenome]|uniref:Uncharacterized protein n=1 Tax=bioreactor metagenome TaxID=1076179 RepID=A0A645HYF8_9ZZZZ